jgi:hypothetical protein
VDSGQAGRHNVGISVLVERISCQYTSNSKSSAYAGTCKGNLAGTSREYKVMVLKRKCIRIIRADLAGDPER